MLQTIVPGVGVDALLALWAVSCPEPIEPLLYQTDGMASARPLASFGHLHDLAASRGHGQFVVVHPVDHRWYTQCMRRQGAYLCEVAEYRHGRVHNTAFTYPDGGLLRLGDTVAVMEAFCRTGRMPAGLTGRLEFY